MMPRRCITQPWCRRIQKIGRHREKATATTEETTKVTGMAARRKISPANKLNQKKGGRTLRVVRPVALNDDYWTVTLSSVEILMLVLSWEHTANPARTLAAMVIVVELTCVHVVPSAEL